MLFNSLQFAIFLPIVFILYWLLPHKFRWPLLLIASYYFYMSWNPKYVVLIFLTTVVSYVAALLIEKEKAKKKAKNTILVIALLICLGVLFVFKYFNFFMQTVIRILSNFTIQLSPVTLKLLLPVGISFYTFQTLSYVIDVYKGKIKAERNFGIYATFVSFFPQLVAGPIERSSNLLPQIRSEKKFDYNNATYGLKLMAWGYFKKMAIADVLAVYVDKAYSNIGACTGFDLLIAVFFFSVQIYCDFSGYSDIAIGAAKLMGVNLMTNFRSPYFSLTIKEFWSRWHISLSTWFKDYVYIPLGGNRVSKFRNYLNLLITFLISGLWHGANFTFIVWGGIHGIMQIIEKMFRIDKEKKNLGLKIVSWAGVFIFCNIAWVFFRAENMMEAINVFQGIFAGLNNPSTFIHTTLDISKKNLFIIIGLIGILGAFDYKQLKYDVIERVSNQNIVLRWFAYIAFVIGTILCVCNLGVSNASFVYFQF